MNSDLWDMQEAMNGGLNPFDLDNTWDPTPLPDSTPIAQNIAGSHLDMYGEMGAWPAQQHTKAPNAAPLQDVSGSFPMVKALAATKSKRKKPANGQRPKETEEEDDKKGTTDLIDEAQAVYPGHQYAHPDPSSGRLYDETVFKIEHEPWGPDRKDRPDIYFQWEADERQPHRPHPGFMKHDEKRAGVRKTSPEKRAEMKKSGCRAAGATPQFKKSKSLLRQAVAKNASQHREKVDEAPVFDTDSDDEDVPPIVRKRQQRKPVSPIFSTDSYDDDVPVPKTKRQRAILAARIFSSDSEDEDAPIKVTKRKRPAVPVVESDSDDEAAPAIESESDSDPDPIVVNPKRRRRTTKTTIERDPPATPGLLDPKDDAHSNGTENDDDLLQQLRRVNKRVRDDLAGYLAGDDTPLAKRQCVPQDQNAYPVGGTNEYQRKAKRSRHLSQSRPQQRQHSQTSQEHLGDILADRVAKVVASIMPADLNPLQTASTSERYYDQVAEALQPTREAYLDLTGYEAPSTNRWDSYATQWQRIYNSFKFEWGMITDGKIPDLVRLSPKSSLHPLLREWCGARSD